MNLFVEPLDHVTERKLIYECLSVTHCGRNFGVVSSRHNLVLMA